MNRIPSELVALSHLDELYLYENKMVGSIPSLLADLPALRDVDISTNSLTGTFPNELFNIPTLTSIISGQNQDLRGVFPETIEAKGLEVCMGNASFLSFLLTISRSTNFTLPVLTIFVENQLCQYQGKFTYHQRRLSRFVLVRLHLLIHSMAL